MTVLTVKIDGMSCGRCVSHVTKALGALEGVIIDQVVVGGAQVQFDPATQSESAILDAIRGTGYVPTPVSRPRESCCG